MTAIVDMTCLRSSNSNVLDNEQTKILFKKFKFENDLEARDKIVYSNIKLVLNTLKQFSNRGENINDLFQIGCIGLIKAVNNFDLSRELRFSTYAFWMVSGEIKRYLRDNSLLRVNRSYKNTLYAINRMKEKFINTHGKEPTNNEVAEELGITEKEISKVMLSLQPISFLSELVDSDSGKVSLADKISDDRISEESLVGNIALRDALRKLGEKERKIINMRYFLEKTQAEVANEFGVSQCQISRLEKSAIKELKRYLK